MHQWLTNEEAAVFRKLRAIRERSPERFAAIEKEIAESYQALERKFSATVP